MKKMTFAGAMIATVLGVASVAQAQEIKRYSDPAGHFPISTAVEVPAGLSTVYLSGMGAPPLDPKSTKKTVDAYGDTATQTAASLKRIENALQKLGLTMGDVVQMHVYLANDPKSGKLDFPGMMKGYTQFFGTKEQPALPVRSAFGVAHLANPGWLVEIEVVAVRPKH